MLWDDANVHPNSLLPKVKEWIFVIVRTISPFGSHPKGLFFISTLLKFQIMRTLNSIAVEYLLRNDSQNNNNKSEDVSREVIRLNVEQDIKSQKSLLLLMYSLEEEGEDFFIQ